MKKILFIIVLLLIPISVYAKEDYKIIADIDLEVENSSSVSYKKYDNTLIITTKNELYKINTITGEKKRFTLKMKLFHGKDMHMIVIK